MTLDGDFTPEEFDKARRTEEEFPTLLQRLRSWLASDLRRDSSFALKGEDADAVVALVEAAQQVVDRWGTGPGPDPLDGLRAALAAFTEDKP